MHQVASCKDLNYVKVGTQGTPRTPSKVMLLVSNPYRKYIGKALSCDHECHGSMIGDDYASALGVPAYNDYG